MSKVISLFHIVFATRGRVPALNDAIRADFHRIMVHFVTELGCRLYCINSVRDHVHILVNLSHKISLSMFMQSLKAQSSAWIKRDGRSAQFAGWGKGYYGCTVSPSGIDPVIAYIENQTQHHCICQFDSEIKSMCTKWGLTYHPNDLA